MMDTTRLKVGDKVPDSVFYIGLRDQADRTLTLFRTPQEVIAALDPAYLSEGAADDYAAFAARWRLALAFIAAGHDALDAGDISSMADDERFALSACGKRAVTDVTQWDSQIPLYLMATAHAPYTDVPLPTGAAVYPIDPYTETTLVASLADAGLLDAWPVQPGQVWDGGKGEDE